jgi:hypothetical protein
MVYAYILINTRKILFMLVFSVMPLLLRVELITQEADINTNGKNSIWKFHVLRSKEAAIN